MDALPSNIMFDIFSRLPATCLARFWCVSKAWCNYINDPYLLMISHNQRVIQDPTPILYHPHVCREKLTGSMCFHVLDSKQARASHNYILEAKEGPFFELLRKKPLPETNIVNILVEGSYNGLMCLSQDEDEEVTKLVVVHPLRKECYEVPPLPMPFRSSTHGGSYGFGFDASTNTLKMLYVKKYQTMVHVCGTNSWREIPQVLSYLFTGKAVFANGCLHWLTSYCKIKTEVGRRVIQFDLEKEQFGLIDRPNKMCGLSGEYRCLSDHLVDLNGEVGYMCTRTMEVWVLKQNEWVPHCRFDRKAIPYNCYIKVMGCWNRNGDILIKSIRNLKYVFLVYNLKTGVLHKTNIAGRYDYDEMNPDIFMFPNTLSSIHGIINTNSSSLKKTILKRSSCQRALSLCAPWH